jgi:hypothetical protein
VSDPSPDERSPLRAAVAVAVSIALLVVLANLTRVGDLWWILVPLLGAWVVTVFLGAPLNAPPQFWRLRRLGR